jgi:hypothetical protein
MKVRNESALNLATVVFGFAMFVFFTVVAAHG